MTLHTDAGCINLTAFRDVLQCHLEDTTSMDKTAVTRMVPEMENVAVTYNVNTMIISSIIACADA